MKYKVDSVLQNLRQCIVDVFKKSDAMSEILTDKIVYQNDKTDRSSYPHGTGLQRLAGSERPVTSIGGLREWSV